MEEVGNVRTYDPLDGVVYVHMVRDIDVHASAFMSTHTQNQLPRGYANKSPRTRLTRSPG